MSNRTKKQNGYFHKVIDRNKPNFQPPLIIEAKPAKLRYIILFIITFGRKGRTYDLRMSEQPFPGSAINCRCIMHPIKDISAELKEELEQVSKALTP